MWFIIIIGIFTAISLLCWLDTYIKHGLWTTWHCSIFGHNWNHSRSDSFTDAYCDRCNLGHKLIIKGVKNVK